MRRTMLIVLGIFLFAGLSFAGLQVNPVTGKLDVTGASGWTTDSSTKATTTYNVGIGSMVPGQILDVQGSVRISGQDGITNNWGDSLDFFGCGDNNLCFRVNAAPTSTDGVFGIEYSDNTQISISHDGTNMVIDSTVGGISTPDFFRSAMQTVTVADNGGGTAATGTVTPTTNNIRLQCNDANGCTMSMSETGAQTGFEATIVNNTSNTATFADSAGVLETIAGASCVMALNDSMTIFYQNSTWLVTSCVDH